MAAFSKAPFLVGTFPKAPFLAGTFPVARWLWVLLLVSACSEPAEPLDAAQDGPAFEDAHPRDSPSLPPDTPQSNRGAPDVLDDLHDSNVSDVSDVSADAERPDPLWRPLPNMPDICPVEYAAAPENVVSLGFHSCGEGCSLLDMSEPYWDVGGSAGQIDGLGYFQLRGQARDTGQQVVALANVDGQVVGAWRGPNRRDEGVCGVGAPSVAGGHAGFVITVYLERTGLRQERIYHAPLALLNTGLDAIRVMTPETGFPVTTLAQPLLASATTAIARVPPFYVYIFQDGELDILGGTPPVVDSPQRILLVGDHAFWSEWQQPDVRIAHGRFGQPAQVFLEVPGVRIPDFTTDGHNFVWSQCYGWVPFRCERQELWTAPYVDDPADLEPRMLIRDFHSGKLLPAGAYATRSHLVSRPHFLESYRIADGARFVYRPSFADVDRVLISDDAVYATEDEIAFAVKFDRSSYALMRVQYSAFVEEPIE